MISASSPLTSAVAAFCVKPLVEAILGLCEYRVRLGGQVRTLEVGQSEKRQYDAGRFPVRLAEVVDACNEGQPFEARIQRELLAELILAQIEQGAGHIEAARVRIGDILGLE